MEFARLVLVSWRHLFVSPGSVSHSAFEQIKIIKLVTNDRLQEFEVRVRGFGVFQSRRDYNKRRKLVTKTGKLPAF